MAGEWHGHGMLCVNRPLKSLEIPHRAQHLEGLYCLLGLPDSEDEGATIVRNVGNLNSNHMVLNSTKAKFQKKKILLLV